jgi:hypothetical protein
MYPNWLNEILICPETRHKITFIENTYRRDVDFSYPYKKEILSAVYPHLLKGSNARYNQIYRFLAPFYDLNE